MFGHHQQKRAKKKLKQQQSEFEEKKKAFEADSPENQKKAAQAQESMVEEKTKKAGEAREKGYAKGKERSEELFQRKFPGLAPEKRNALQSEANLGIHRGAQTTNRKLLGEQAQRGLVGKGGVRYAQQKDLANAETSAKGQVQRDIDKLNSDLELKQMAAAFNIEQGEGAQEQLDRQNAVDELHLLEEQKKQKYWEDQANRYFNRI